MALSLVVKADTIQGSNIRVDKSGYHLTRRIVVGGCFGTSDWSTVQLAVLQNSAITSIGVFRGSPHPWISGLYCSNYHIASIAEDGTTCEIIVEYEEQQADKQSNSSQAPILTIDSVVSSQQTNVDKDGYPLYVSYNGEEQTGTVNIDVVMAQITLTRREPYTCNPLAQITTYNEKVNSGSVSVGGQFCPASTLKVSGINATSQVENGTLTYLMKYTFLYDPINYWTATVAYQDKEGKIPFDVDYGNGLEVYEMYPSVSFSGFAGF